MTPPKMSSDLRREFYIYHCTNIQHHPQTSQPYYFIGIKDWLLKILTRMSSQSDTATLETYLKSSVGLISKNINEYLNFKFRLRFWKMMNFWNTTYVLWTVMRKKLYARPRITHNNLEPEFFLIAFWVQNYFLEYHKNFIQTLHKNNSRLVFIARIFHSVPKFCAFKVCLTNSIKYNSILVKVLINMSLHYPHKLHMT